MSDELPDTTDTPEANGAPGLRDMGTGDACRHHSASTQPPEPDEPAWMAQIRTLVSTVVDTRTLVREVATVLFTQAKEVPNSNRVYRLIKRGSLSTISDELGQFWEAVRSQIDSDTCASRAGLPVLRRHRSPTGFGGGGGAEPVDPERWTRLEGLVADLDRRYDRLSAEIERLDRALVPRTLTKRGVR